MVDSSKKVLAKVVLIGDLGVGKTSLLNSISNQEKYKKKGAAATVAVDFRDISMQIG